MEHSRMLWKYGTIALVLLVLFGWTARNFEWMGRLEVSISSLFFSSKELLPDLSPLPPGDLVIERAGGALFLRFSTTYYNQGRGPLELRADPNTAGIKDDIERNVLQRVYEKDDTYTDSKVGTFLWHEEHLHYHFADFIDYNLTPVDTPKGDGPAGKRTKATFCVRDVSNVKLDLSERAEEAVYRICGKELQGISVGWADTYFYDYPDQNLDISGLASGTYRLTLTVNPNRLFRELNYKNNVSSVLFSFDAENETFEVLEELPHSAPQVEHVHLEQPFGIGSPEPEPSVSLTSVVAEQLEIPWDFAFLPHGMLVAERTGRVLIFVEGQRREVSIDGSDIVHRGEGGLLGMALHPDFETNRFVYLYHTTPSEGGGLINRVVRYTFTGDGLFGEKTIIDNIPGAQYHDGGRIEFGPDGLLYITTGDAGNARLAQNKDSLAGKILRVRDDGSVPSGNPFGTAVYSFGHRNPQGLAWDSVGRLWETEHGRSGVLSGLDEINLIQSGKNYGWPDSEGDKVLPNTEAPARHSGPTNTWAPASVAYLAGSLYFGGLRGEALYEAVLDGARVVELKAHFKGEFGRIRTVRVGPDGMLYMTTSNRDGRGSVKVGDDKIIRVNPNLLD